MHLRLQDASAAAQAPQEAEEPELQQAGGPAPEEAEEPVLQEVEEPVLQEVEELVLQEVEPAPQEAECFGWLAVFHDTHMRVLLAGDGTQGSTPRRPLLACQGSRAPRISRKTPVSYLQR
jgi:hypothetical protein